MSRSQNTALVIGGVIVAIVVFLLFIFLLTWGFRISDFGMMGPSMMGRSVLMLFVITFVIVILGLLIWAVVVIAQKANSSDSATINKTESPLDILKRRYAQGEIDKEEYESKKRDLTQ